MVRCQRASEGPAGLNLLFLGPDDPSCRTAAFGHSARPRVCRPSNTPLSQKNKLPAIPTSGPGKAQATETKSTVLRPRAERARGAVVTGVSSHHNEAIRRMYNLILSQSLRLASVSFGFCR